MHAYSNWFWELGAGFWQFGIQTPGTLDVLPSIRWGMFLESDKDCIYPNPTACSASCRGRDLTSETRKKIRKKTVRSLTTAKWSTCYTSQNSSSTFTCPLLRPCCLSASGPYELICQCFFWGYFEVLFLALVASEKLDIARPWNSFLLSGWDGA